MVATVFVLPLDCTAIQGTKTVQTGFLATLHYGLNTHMQPWSHCILYMHRGKEGSVEVRQ